MNRRGGGGGRGRGIAGRTGDRPKKEQILDLNSQLNKKVHIKFSGGRSAVGTLMGFDPLQNLVLEDTVETTQTGNKRQLGLAVLRSTNIILVAPAEGYEEIQNPFV